MALRKLPQGWHDSRIGGESSTQAGDEKAWEPTGAASQGQREGSGDTNIDKVKKPALQQKNLLSCVSLKTTCFIITSDTSSFYWGGRRILS